MLYEWREYKIVPGRMPSIKARFRDITLDFFKKHGIEVVDFWESEVGGETGSLYYMLKWRDLRHRQEAWGAFASDPEWIRAKAETEKDGPIVASIHNMLLRKSDILPPES